MDGRFVSEAVRPVAGSCDTARMAAGEPGLPRAFVWHGRTLVITRVCRAWRETGPCRSGSPEAYVRKHWYEVEADSGERLKLYCERQPRGGRRAPRWWLFSVAERSGDRTDRTDQTDRSDPSDPSDHSTDASGERPSRS